VSDGSGSASPGAGTGTPIPWAAGPIVQRLLAAVDFSAVSKDVVEAAETLAHALSAELTLIHVAAPDPDFVGYAAGPETVREGRARELRTEHREIQAIAEGLRNRGISARALLIQGPAVEKILAEGQRLRADVIIIGSHGHGALYRALLGSVSEGVVRASQCPVLVVPVARSTDRQR
jgi:nucleotide-binding universal stress UspA family protein